MFRTFAFVVLAALIILAGRFDAIAQEKEMDMRDAMRVKPYQNNPRYWQYQDKPVMLLGGTNTDKLFQLPDLEKHLDLLASVGGNYVRNTMSDRPTLGNEAKAFLRRDDGKYDLNQWNPEYWERFENMLKWTAERNIIVQIEVWDRFDHSTDPWKADPFNPINNINYTQEETKLAPEYPEHPGRNLQPFFYSVPALDNNQTLLNYQRRFVDKMLSHSLRYGHVLYCMDNETNGSPEWGKYWAQYIRRKATEAGVNVELTEMWDAWDVTHRMHRRTLDNPDLYSFVDISQNSQVTDQKNWAGAQHVRNYIAEKPRPINSTKIYGADTSIWVERGIVEKHAKNTFWRNILGGFASSRFHRPASGLGLGESAQAQLRSARMLLAELDIFRCQPDSNHALLADRDENEAYLTRIEGQAYAVYFTEGGEVGLDLRNVPGNFTVKWLNIDASRWDKTLTVAGGAVITLATPQKGHWVALVKKN